MADDQPQGSAPSDPTLAAAGVPAEAPVVPAAESDELSLPNPLVLAAIGLILLSIVTFLPTLRGEPTWQDDVSLTDNPFVQASSGVARFWDAADRAGRYQPMTLTSFWLGFRIFHENLVATHFVNILLHAAVVLLLWHLLRKLEVPAAWLAAAIFAVHPVHTQAIAWISGRSVVLASVFYLSALLVYLRYLGLNPPIERKTLFTLPPEPERLWGLALALFICGLASNAAATVTFPLAVVVLLWWKRAAVTAKEWLALLPFIGAAIAGGAWVGWLQYGSPTNGALRATFGPTSVVDRILFGFRAIWFYAAKIVVPYPLIFDYPRWNSNLALDAAHGLGLVVLFFVLWKMRDRFGRGSLAAVALFVIAIGPMLSLLDPPAMRYSFVADYRQYLASAAMIALVVSAVAGFILDERWRDKVNPAYCAGAALILLAVLSFHQGTFYLTSDGLWKQTLEQNPSSVMAAEGYGDALLNSPAMDSTVLDAAGEWFARAQSIAPNDPRAEVGLGTVAAAAGYEDQATGHPELAGTQQTSAQQYFRDAIRLDPDFKPAYVALAELLKLKHDDAGAIDALTQAIRIDPDSVRTRLQLGAAQRRVGDLKAAEATLTDLLEDAPNNATAHSELGNVYMQEHDPSAALPEWQKAIQLDPINTSVLLNFGALLDSSGQTELAAKQFQAATMIDPTLLPAHVYLANVYLKLGHRADAVAQLTQAMALDPNSDEVKAAYMKAMAEQTAHGPGTPATSQPATAPAGGDVIDSSTQPTP